MSGLHPGSGGTRPHQQKIVEAAATAVNPLDVVLSSGTPVGKPALRV
ncbi:MAG: hypothetical protein J2P26_09635 [Nocardiopsaceae bacterium]|nr:hypothetical protein [Nocardiopsaceae bacterium]